MTESGVRGQIHGIGLDSFLQMAQMEKTTCTLVLKADSDVGYMYLLKGELIDAATETLSGKDAACEIVSWEHSVIEIENTCSKKTNEINLPLMTVLMEGLKIKDEKRSSGAPATKAPIDLKEPVPVQLPPAVAKVPGSDAQPLRKAAKPTGSPPRPMPMGKTGHGNRTQTKTTTPARKRPYLKMAAGVLMVVACAALAFVYFFSDGVKDDYQQMLLILENQTDPAGQIDVLNAFINSHGASDYTRKAEQRRDEIQELLEVQDFEEVTVNVGLLPVDESFEKSAIDQYNRYLSKYPDGRFAEEARQKIRDVPSLFEDADFEKVAATAASGTEEQISVYRRYLERHPAGRHRTEVQKLLENIGASYFSRLSKQVDTCDRNQTWDDCLSLCNEFIATFKDDPHLAQVTSIRKQLQSRKDFSALATSAQQKKNDYAAAKAVYLAYLNDHPDALHKDQIQSEIAKLDEKIAWQSQWQVIAEDSNNGRKDIFVRVNQLDRYMRSNPSSPFIAEAEILRARLENERQAAEAQRRRQTDQQQKLAVERQTNELRQQENMRRVQLEEAVIDRLNKAGNRYRANRNGTVTDTTTGLTWTLLDSQLELGGCLNYSSGEAYVGQLQTGGYRDWRLPTAGELAAIYKNPPYFPAGGGTWYWSSESYVKGYHRVANIVTTQQETVYNIKQERQDQCGAVHAVRP